MARRSGGANWRNILASEDRLAGLCFFGGMMGRAFALGAAFSLMGFFVFPTGGLGEERPPNIVFILTDDQAPWALGIAGHPDTSTPNLDHFAGEGAYLPNSFTVTPVCSPSRASLMTSRYGSELGITDWIKPQKGGIDEETTIGLDAGVSTFPKVLAAAGYRTGLVGKWHLGENPEHHPTQLGYQYFMGFRAGGTTPVDPTLEVDGEPAKLKGLTVDIITDYAIAFLEEEREGPFFICRHYR
jgi:choline-sulfatase